jgi:hypothetical protein
MSSYKLIAKDFYNNPECKPSYLQWTPLSCAFVEAEIVFDKVAFIDATSCRGGRIGELQYRFHPDP